MNLILRVMKNLDNKGRLLIPKPMLRKVKSNRFYVELYEDYIKLVPIKTKRDGDLNE